MSERYIFLSPEWIEAARRLRDEHLGDTSRLVPALRLNQLVREVPFQSEPITAYLDTSEGAVVFEVGELEDPDVSIALDYEVAKAIVTGGDPSVLLESFLAGRIQVTGDMTKLLAIQGVFSASDEAEAMTIAEKIREFTD
ncbi:MAG: SCP2 sterol-binding domain-containing protein [Acidimicrobiales bacterium]